MFALVVRKMSGARFLTSDPSGDPIHIKTQGRMLGKHILKIFKQHELRTKLYMYHEDLVNTKIAGIVILFKHAMVDSLTRLCLEGFLLDISIPG